MQELGLTVKQYKELVEMQQEREAQARGQEGIRDDREPTDGGAPMQFSVPSLDEIFTKIVKSAGHSLSGIGVPRGGPHQPNRPVFRLARP